MQQRPVDCPLIDELRSAFALQCEPYHLLKKGTGDVVLPTCIEQGVASYYIGSEDGNLHWRTAEEAYGACLTAVERDGCDARILVCFAQTLLLATLVASHALLKAPCVTRMSWR